MGKDAVRAPEHPPHVWEAQRRRFTQLYKGEKRKLVEVQRIMQDEHGFYATERQYKRKIKQWNLEKHAKAVEKSRALVTLKEMDAKLDLGCVYKLNGKSIAAHKLRRFARSHGIEAPSIVRKDINNKRRATESRLRGITTSLAFLPDNPDSTEVRFVDLHELFASVVCFLWFEPMESMTSLSRPLSAESVPTSGFRKWTSIILKTTQLPPNDVILAMLFIYRLKVTNPSVIGKGGSEYRLATVALMLANKFLDDNTYTNKTWAEVSGISVKEVHVMEVEFLSNMRYSLMTSSLQWDSWYKYLGKLQNLFHQTPPEPARIHESPDGAQSEQQTDPPRIVELPDVPQNNRYTRPCRFIELPDRFDDDPQAALPISAKPAADTVQRSMIRYVQQSSQQSDPDIEMSDTSNDIQRLRTKHGAGLDSRDPMQGQSKLLHPVETAAFHTEQSTTHGHSPSPSESPQAFQLAGLDLDQNVLPMPDHNQDMDGIITAASNEGLDYTDDALSKFLASSPSFPFTLAMEHPPPLPNLDDAPLFWIAHGSREYQLGPIPDLDDYLDSSLWEEGWSSSELAWKSVPLVEAPGTGRTSSERGAGHDGDELLRVIDASTCDEEGWMDLDG